MKILVLNAGSSSQKSYLYEIRDGLPDTAPEPLWEGLASWGEHQGKATINVKTAHGKLEKDLPTDSRTEIIAQLLPTMWSGETKVIENPSEINMVGHRVVHGGSTYQDSVALTAEVQAEIKKLADFAPLHNPAALEGMEAVEKTLPGIPQFAVFDTSFHKHLPQAVTCYPGPYEWFEQGIRRYGFHGISYQYCLRRAGQLLGRRPESLRLIVCHLGNGCSLAAIRDGKSINTTMGFTPLEGLMMGGRSGTIDPSILTYLMRKNNATADQLDQILNKESGLKGISGVSSDLREVLKARTEGNERAKLAFDMYVGRLQMFISSMLPQLGAFDALVFAGGVGENSQEVREATVAGFSFLGLKLDAEKNAQSPADTNIATEDSSARVLIIHTQEDWEIAREGWQLVEAGKMQDVQQ